MCLLFEMSHRMFMQISMLMFSANLLPPEYIKSFNPKMNTNVIIILKIYILKERKYFIRNLRN